MHRRTMIIISVIAVLALSLGLAGGCGLLPEIDNPFAGPETAQITLPSDFKIMEEAWQVLSRDYVDAGALDTKKLSEGAVRGMISALGDPYTAYLERDLSAVERSRLSSVYGGIGAVVGTVEDQIVVVEAFPGSPASLAGIRAGDRIVAIEGESTSGLTVADAVLRIRGEKGTAVTLTIMHHGESEPIDLELVRGDIKITTVNWEPLADGIAYVRITHFSESTRSELTSALTELRDQGSKAIVLDLRANPGGLLDSAVDVASQFLEDGVVVWEGLGDDQWREWEVRPDGLATDLPLAVLVDGQSASGSEVVTGALQDHERAVVIGEKTFGKGSVNLMRELSDGSSLYITHARWLTPDRNLIEGEGITPDQVVPMTPEQKLQGIDPQLDRAVDYLRAAITSAQPTPA